MLEQSKTHREIGEALRKKGRPAKSDKITKRIRIAN